MDHKAKSAGGERKEQGLEVRSEAHIDDATLIDEVNIHKGSQIVINDWSLTGRGSHVDFGDKEAVPLEQGRFLGRGAMGDVHETVIQGWKLAHKKILFRRKIGDKEKTEIEILKRLSHVHMLQLIGTYTQQKILGILTYPVAVCDLHTFFEDVEAWSTVEIQKHPPAEQYEALDPVHKDRLETLGYNFPAKDAPYKASPVYSKIGCLISAVAYLHDQKIRHKDLKPSNILLSRDRLWLSDFGSATDFTLLSQSATDNERGTPRYFAPEVAGWMPNGRAADVFSLGCVLLEVLVIHDRGTLEHIRQNRSPDPSFHANLDRVETWLQPYNKVLSPRRYHLLYEIKAMLSRDPAKRPTVQDLLTKIVACDLGRASPSTPSVFSKCCQRLYISRQEHEMHTLQSENKIARLEAHLRTDRVRMQAEHKEQTSALRKTIDQLNQQLYEARDALEGQIQTSNAISMALEQEEENMQASQLQLSDEKEGRSNAEIMMRQLLAEKQRQDIRIAWLEVELESKTTIIESSESQKPRALRGEPNPLGLQRRSAKYFDTVDSLGRPIGNSRLDTTASKAKISRERPSPPSPNVALRQYPASTTRLTDRDGNQFTEQEKSIRPASSAWRRFLFPDTVSGDVSRDPSPRPRPIILLDDSELENELASLPASRETRWEQVYVDGDTKLVQRGGRPKAAIRKTRELENLIELSDHDSKDRKRRQDHLKRSAARMEAMKSKR